MAFLRAFQNKLLPPVLFAASAATLFGPAWAESARSGVRAAAPTTTPPELPSATAIRWHDGELIPPLPTEAATRASAIAEARSRSKAERGGTAVVAPTADTAIRPRLVVLERGVHSHDDPGRPSPPEVHFPAPIAPSGIRAEEAGRDSMNPSSRKKARTASTAAQARLAKSGAVPVDPVVHKLQNVVASFDAIDHTGLAPAHCQVAAGIDHVGVVVNDRLAFYDKCGGSVVAEVSFAQFIGVTGRTYSNPRIVYDEWDHRWVISVQAIDAAAQESSVFIAASRNGNPIGGWWVYGIDMGQSGQMQFDQFGDDTDLGVDPVGVWITSNQHSWTTFTAETVWVRMFDKSQIYAGGPVGGFTWILDSGLYGGNNPFSLRCATMRSWSGTFYFVATALNGGNDVFMMGFDSVIPPNSFSFAALSTGSYDLGDPIEQPDGSFVSVGDTRTTDAAYYAGHLWFTHGRGAGLSDDDPAIGIGNIEPFVDVDYVFLTSVSSYELAYPGLEIVSDTEVLLGVTYGGPDDFLGLAAIEWDGFSAPITFLQAGQANYAGGGDGTLQNPHRWGPDGSVARDPFDPNILWVGGPFASDDPVPSWDTHVTAISAEGPGVLTMFETGPFISIGLVGGPFSPPTQTFTLINTGGAALHWTAQDLEPWHGIAPLSGQLAPGGSQVVTMFLTQEAYELGPGIWDAEDLSFGTCGGQLIYPTPELRIGDGGSCDGSVTALSPPTGNWTNNNDPGENGLFVTTLDDVNVCAVGMSAELDVPRIVTARIYEATGVARGPLVAENSATVVASGSPIHWIPLSATLDACKEYDIAFEISGAVSWHAWNESFINMPYDVGALLRVRDAEAGGDPASSSIPYIAIVTDGGTCGRLADLAPNAQSQLIADGAGGRGVYVTTTMPGRVCSVGLEADLTAGDNLSAVIWKANGTNRTGFLASGNLTVMSSGLQYHDVPVNAMLGTQQDYDITFYHDGGVLSHWDEGTIMLPYGSDPIQVVDGEHDGDPASTLLPKIHVGWQEVGAGPPVDFVLPGGTLPPPFTSTDDGRAWGIYVDALASLEVKSIGLMANPVAGETETMTMLVYAAANQTRGELLAMSTAIVNGGMQWHDIPISVSFQEGQQYDIEVWMGNMEEYRYWDPTDQFPYTVSGALRVVASEEHGIVDPVRALLHFRLFACTPPSGVVGIPSATGSEPQLFLAAPFPNPVLGTSTLHYSLDGGGPVKLSLFDVRGRRVMDLVDARESAGVHEIRLNTLQVARGMYFIRLETPGATISRKILVVK